MLFLVTVPKSQIWNIARMQKGIGRKGAKKLSANKREVIFLSVEPNPGLKL